MSDELIQRLAAASFRAVLAGRVSAPEARATLEAILAEILDTPEGWEWRLAPKTYDRVTVN